MKKFLFSTLVFTVLLIAYTQAQTTSFVFRCNRDTSIAGCSSACLTLRAKIPNVRKSTTDYVINPLSANSCYQPYVGSNTPGQSASISNDDRYSTVVNLPFSFPFYDDPGSPYNQLVISTNGYLSFDVSKATQFSHWSMTPGNVPNTGYDRALVMGVFHDLDPTPSIGTSPTQQIKYEILGDAPYRRFVLSFYRVPLFSTACNALIENTHQIVLYETLGVIEVFVNDVQQCPGWNQGRKMIGLQNYNRNKGIMAPNRTATGPSWGNIGMNESWRFVPAAGPTLYRGVKLYDLAGNLVSTGDTVALPNGDFQVTFPNVCPTMTSAGIVRYVIKSTYESPSSPGTMIYGTDTLDVRVDVVRIANASVTNVVCNGASTGVINMTAAGAPGGIYQYSINGGTPQASGVFNNLPAGTYAIHIADPSLTACPKDTTITITEPPATMSVSVSQANQTILLGDQPEISAAVTGTTNYLWSSSPIDPTLSSTTILNPTATPAVSTIYTLTATNAAGCTKSGVVNVTVIPYCVNPRNAFTPNGDGINDNWLVYDGRGCINGKIKVTVFNRYGNKVFESQDYFNDWGGTYNGKPVPDGTYYGIMEFPLINGKTIVKRTDINIIR